MSQWDAFYRDQLGDRWPGLRQALRAPARHVAYLNPFVSRHGVAGRHVLGLEGCLETDGPFLPPAVGAEGLLPYYLLDGASVFAARALAVEPGDRVLDLCAAPGGKTLVLAASLGDTGRLVANERSVQRRQRLSRVLDAYLPPSIRQRVTVTGHDAACWGLHEPAAYDRVLLDAPCSGERHLLGDSSELASWSPKRTKRLAQQQFAMLCAALEAVRVGGRIVYSTCALSPLENDGVLDKLQGRRPGRFRLLAPQCPVGEATRHGWQVWPDTTGWGPIYWAVLERLL